MTLPMAGVPDDRDDARTQSKPQSHWLMYHDQGRIGVGFPWFLKTWTHIGIHAILV
jgi:hypothetical protein